MNGRIRKEFELLRRYYPQAEWHEVAPSGWLRIPDYKIHCDLWNREATTVCFEVTAAYPGGAPYAFYVEAGLYLKSTNGRPQNNYTEPAPTPFPGTWGKFSWQQLDPWIPTADVVSGNNLTSFVRSFQHRFSEGA